MTAREEILRAVRAARPASVPPPDVAAAVRAFPRPAGDVAERFAEAARAGGAAVVEGAREEVVQLVAAAAPEAGHVLSMAAAVPGSAPLPDSPHAASDADVFVCEGVFGVAENGAVWLPGSRLGRLTGHRAALFLAQHVVVLLDRGAVVSDMHAAYARIDVGAEPFGVFVAGPSKTADIEQSLVVGAHGPKGLTVVLLRG